MTTSILNTMVFVMSTGTQGEPIHSPPIGVWVPSYVPNPRAVTRIWGETHGVERVAFFQIDADPWTPRWLEARRVANNVVDFFSSWKGPNEI